MQASPGEIIIAAQTNRAIARLLGVHENAVRYHLQRQVDGATDGRARQRHLAGSACTLYDLGLKLSFSRFPAFIWGCCTPATC